MDLAAREGHRSGGRRRRWLVVSVLCGTALSSGTIVPAFADGTPGEQFDRKGVFATPQVQRSTGGRGEDGAPASAFGSGNNGRPGGDAGFNGLVIEGGSIDAGAGAAVILQNRGGVGGNGSNDSSGLGVDTHGGDGGLGGGLGAISFSLAPDAQLASSNLGATVFIEAVAGAGGEGALGWNHGHGGAGGSGDSAVINTAIAGTVTHRGTLGAAVLVRSAGGAGGLQNGSFTPGYNNGTRGGHGGAGATFKGEVSGSIVSGYDGISILTSGGGGGSAGGTNEGVSTGGVGARGISGGNGGDGAGLGGSGPATLDISGSIIAARSAVEFHAYGGSGGSGGIARGGAQAQGGSGGQGGGGGAIRFNLGASGSITTTGVDEQLGRSLPAIWLQANGGKGGNGGDGGAVVGIAGGAGFGGSGGEVVAVIDGTIDTAANFAHGVLAQTVGGAGGDGNNAFGIIYAEGSSGHRGGHGGSVTVSGRGNAIATEGTGASAIVAQSIGGGGGSGGNALAISSAATVALGGNGGAGGDGKAVLIGGSGDGASPLSKVLVTRGNEAPAILAQSIGGAGGSAGSATALNLGVLALAIGGDGRSGGNGDRVVVDNAGLITTFGAKSGGISAQSIGGGGGRGGSGLGFGVGVINASVAVGGRGSNGGASGAVDVINRKQITTYGDGSYGISAQAISGGGGEGGAATSTAIALSPAKEVPAIAVSVAVGGSGGAGGDQSRSPVTVWNDGLITTAGSGASGIIAQNIAGGGGSAGDASAWSYAGGQSAINISSSVAVGGKGGAGGTGGKVEARNDGLILTIGESSYGVFAQSIGGGGGIAGTGDASSGAAGGKKLDIAGSIAVGGQGGGGSRGGEVLLANSGGIATNGDGSHALFGQSIGGGGGVAGGGVGKANSGMFALNVAVGGAGGNGGHGGNVAVTNTGGLRTSGAEADAIIAQSIGGGGGRGGKGATTTGGAMDSAKAAKNLLDRLKDRMGVDEGFTDLGKDVIEIAESAYKGYKDQKKLDEASKNKDGTKTEKKDKGASGKATTLDISVGVGGAGGAGGDGGTVSVKHEGGSIVTTGARSDAIFAQSVGGGGGIGGAASVSDSDKKKVQVNIGAGGSGGGSGHGGYAWAQTDAGTTILTQGIAASGIVVQSVGGGGGKAGSSVAESKSDDSISDDSISLAFGGGGGASGNGGNVAAYHHGQVVTEARNAVGIIAQTIGGGGGIGHTASTDETEEDLDKKDKQEKVDKIRFNLSFGGRGSNGGDGGLAVVQLYEGAAIETFGRNAYGILAQSIGGGGGAALGGQVSNKSIFGVEGGGGNAGNGGQIDIKVNGTVITGGDGATGVLAQSIGGGGGLGGDTAQSSGLLAFDGQKGGSGNGSSVKVDVAGKIITSGVRADGILAQSVGGGGGFVTTEGGAHFGTAGGNGNGGMVVVDVGAEGKPASVTVSGSGSAAIRAQSSGRNKDSVSVSIAEGSVVTGSHDTPAIIIDGNSSSVVHNHGTINGSVQGGALSAPEGVRYEVHGSSQGNVDAGPGEVTIAGSGTMARTADIIADRLTNDGTFVIGEYLGASDTARISGALRSTGEIVADLDFVSGIGDLLDVGGTADIGGRIVVEPTTLQGGRAVEILRADALHADNVRIEDRNNYLFGYTGHITGNGLAVEATADFTPDDTDLAEPEIEVATYLQRLWDSGQAADMGRHFVELSAVGKGAYANTLASLDGDTVQAVGLARHAASHQFFDNLVSCPLSLAGGVAPQEGSCVWGRMSGGIASLKSTRSAPGFDHKTFSMQVGGQRELGGGWFVGGSVGYEHTRIDASGGSDRVRGDSAHIGLMVKRVFGNWQITGAFDAGYGWYDSQRRVSIGRATSVAVADPKALTLGLHSRIAYQVPFETLYVRPYLDLHATYASVDAYRERGAGLWGLAVSRENDFQFAASPMLEFGTRLSLGDEAAVRPFIAIGAEFHTDNEWGADARFLGALDTPISFTSEARLPTAMAKLNAGVELQAGEKVQFKLEYSGRVGDDFHSHKGLFKLRYLFD